MKRRRLSRHAPLVLAWLVITGGCLAATVTPPTPPPPPSPIALFRQLLASNPATRDQLLTGRSERQRRLIDAKLREYEALAPAECEDRLQATELRWYLRPLLNLPPAARAERLGTAPDRYQELLREHLTRWDELPESARKDLLEYETMLTWLMRSGTAAGGTPGPGEATRSPQVETQLARWRSLPQPDRDRMSRQFAQFFDLSPRQQEQTLNELSDQERQQVEETLRDFRQLPPPQRRLCVESFRKFARLSPEQRSEFLRNADRWRELSPADREAWRQLVTRLPPFPPGFGSPPLPPLPPVAGRAPAPQVAGH